MLTILLTLHRFNTRR